MPGKRWRLPLRFRNQEKPDNPSFSDAPCQEGIPVCAKATAYAKPPLPPLPPGERELFGAVFQFGQEGKMEKVRIGLIGFGVMGAPPAKNLNKGEEGVLVAASGVGEKT